MARETPDSDNDVMCAELKKDEGWKKSVNNSRPVSISSEPEKKWVDIVSGNRCTSLNLKEIISCGRTTNHEKKKNGTKEGN